MADAPQPTLAALGRAVRRLRDERDMTQVELADAAAISTQYLSHIENGQPNPSMGVAARIARGLGVPLSELILQAEQDR